ncbi:hypothetical protein K502DRAFT_325080, partial [Neoconidiobolus thromboides FSU 785]
MSLSFNLIYSKATTSNLTYVVKVGEEGSEKEVSSGKLSIDDGNELSLSASLPQGFMASTYSISDIDIPSAVARRVVLSVSADDKEIGTNSGTVHGMPGGVTLIPIIVLLAVALFSSQALFALMLGLFLSSMFINGFNPVNGFLRMLDYYTVQAVANSDNVKIILFTFYLSGLIALIQKSGGAHGMANSVTRLATNRWRGQWATFIVGILIFFDDFASCLIVGSNMQPVTDTLFLSREKLAFLVHATSSPPASIAPISSWIGFEIGLIKAQFTLLKIDKEPFLIFLETIQSRFYPLYMLLFIIIILVLKRDFGPMLVAERRAFFGKRLVKDNTVLIGDVNDTDPLKPSDQTPRRWINAVIPIIVVVVVTVVALFMSGYYKQMQEEVPDLSATGLAGSGDPYGSLLYSSFLACIIAMILYRIQNIMSFQLSIAIFLHGIKDIVEPLLILILAWSIGIAFADLGAATFIVSSLSTTLDPHAVPVLVFIISCIISFTTGTSWGTMTIMFPLVIPLVHASAKDDHDLLVHCISSILTGAIFGDQCSPISGTSILSALSSKCPVRDHVTTQLPYALLVALTSVIFGYLPVGFNAYPAWAGLLIGIVFMTLVVLLIGTKTESHDISRWDWLMTKFGREPNVENYFDESEPSTSEKKEQPDEFDLETNAHHAS